MSNPDKQPSPTAQTSTTLAQLRESVETASNPLVSAATSILGKSHALQNNRPDTPLPALQAELIAHIEMFAQIGQEKDYTAPMMLSGRYFLAATLDDMIATAPWIKEDEWIEYSLLTHCKQDAADSDRFFLILQRACENPSEHIDLIELGYHCLSIGFMGAYRDKLRGGDAISKLLDKLYTMICEVRGEPNMNLSIGLAPSTQVVCKKRASWSSKPAHALMIWGGAVLIFAAVLLPYQHKLQQLAKPLHAQLSALLTPAQSEIS